MRRIRVLAAACCGFFCLQALSALAGPFTIRGHLEFPHEKVELPPNSTYTVELLDVARADAPSTMIARFIGDADKATQGQRLVFELVIPEKNQLTKAPRSLALFAVVHAGSKEGGRHVRRGDYLTTTTNFISIAESDSIEGVVIKLSQYKRA
ncbi:hypothetical protein Efla_000487 [Eimeria flavescens]